MTVLVKLVADYAIWLYLIVGLVAVIFLRAYMIAHHERENSIFTLERESATSRMVQAIIGFLVTLIIVGGVFYTSQTLVEEIPLPEASPTPTVLVVLPPSPTPPPILPTPTPTGTPRPRPTLVVGTTVTATVEVPTVVLANCPNPGVNIAQPGNGAAASGVIQIVGSATIPEFWYYKFEFRPSGADAWTFIQRFDTPISGGILAAWDTRTVASGSYELRLVVVDKTGNYPEPCILQLAVQN
jgi:hypothetical protein